MSIEKEQEEAMAEIAKLTTVVGNVVDGHPVGPVVSALVIVAANIIENSPMEQHDRKNGVLYMMSIVSRLSVNVGLTDEELLAAFNVAQPEETQNATTIIT